MGSRFSGSNPANNGIMSREQAQARRSELMNDKQWAERYLAGGGRRETRNVGPKTRSSRRDRCKYFALCQSKTLYQQYGLVYPAKSFTPLDTNL
jgi:hypothetical protein